MMKLRLASALSLAMIVSGCMRSSSDVVTQLPEDLAKNSHVTTIVVKSLPANVSSDFRGLLTNYLERETASCAKGAQPLRLEASVVEFSGQNGAATMLIGSSNMIKGSAKLIDPATDKIVGDYEIARSKGAGGLLGLALLSGAEDSMARAFAEDVCDRAFRLDK